MFAVSLLMTVSAMAQGAEQTTFNRSVGAADRAGVESTAAGPAGQAFPEQTTRASGNDPQGTFGSPLGADKADGVR